MIHALINNKCNSDCIFFHRFTKNEYNTIKDSHIIQILDQIHSYLYHSINSNVTMDCDDEKEYKNDINIRQNSNKFICNLSLTPDATNDTMTTENIEYFGGNLIDYEFENDGIIIHPKYNTLKVEHHIQYKNQHKNQHKKQQKNQHIDHQHY